MVFYLPIYKSKNHQQKFIEWLNGKIQKSLSNLEIKSGIPISSRMKLQTEAENEKKYGRSWEQNRAVGWIIINKALGGFTFTISKAYPFSNNLSKKQFEGIPPDKCVGCWHIISFEECTTFESILLKFKSFFKEITSSETFKGCFVDDSSIESIYKFVDWKSFIHSDFDTHVGSQHRGM
jgi:hypothetical protein